MTTAGESVQPDAARLHGEDGARLREMAALAADQTAEHAADTVCEGRAGWRGVGTRICIRVLSAVSLSLGSLAQPAKSRTGG